MLNSNNESIIYHHTHQVTFSTVSNHSYDLHYQPNDSLNQDNNMKSNINWGEENMEADEAYNNSHQPEDISYEYEEGKWFGLEQEGCSMELLGKKVSTSVDQGSNPNQLKRKKKKKQSIRIMAKKPFDISQLKICTYVTEIIDKSEFTIDYYQEQFIEYLNKSGFDNMKGISEEEKVKKLEIAKLAFLEFSRLKQEEINRLVEEELERRLRKKTIDGHISQEEEQKIVDDMSNKYNILIPQAPPFIDIKSLLDKHKKELQRTYRISKRTTIEVIDDRFNAQEYISDSADASNNSDTNQLNDNSSNNVGGDTGKKKKTRHHRRRGRGIEQGQIQVQEEEGQNRIEGIEDLKSNPLDNKTIVIEKLKKLNPADIPYHHTEVKWSQREMYLEEVDNEDKIKHCNTLTQKNNACCPYCRKDKSNASCSRGDIYDNNKTQHQHHYQDSQGNEDKRNANENDDQVNELKNKLTNKEEDNANEDNDNDNEDQEEEGDEDNNNKQLDLDSNEESNNEDNDNEDDNNNDNIYDSNEEDKELKEADKDSDTKRKEARIKAREKALAMEKAKKKSQIKSRLIAKKNVVVDTKMKVKDTKKPQSLQKKLQPKQQLQQQQSKSKKDSSIPIYPQFNNKKKERLNNNIIANQAKTKKIIQTLHKQVSTGLFSDDKIIASQTPSMNNNRSSSFRLKNLDQTDRGKGEQQESKIKPINLIKLTHNKDVNSSNIENKSATAQAIHLRNASQQIIKPVQKKLNITNHTSSKPSCSLNNNDSITNLPIAKTNRTQKDWKKVSKPQLSAASTIAPITGTNFYNTKKIDYITNKDLNFGFESWKENMKNPHFSTKHNRCDSGSNYPGYPFEEKKLKPIKRKTFSNLTNEELERKKKQITELMKDKSNPYSLYWPDKFLNNVCQMGMTSVKSINGVPIVTLVKRKEETIDETFKQIQYELHKQKQLEMSKFHNKSSLSFHPCLDKVNADLGHEKTENCKLIQYPQIFKYFNS